MARTISDWLTGAELPGDLYELLGQFRFEPAREQLQQAVQAANREVFQYQNHQDPAVAHRAMHLLLELGRAAEVLSDAAKLRNYEKHLLRSLRQAYTEQHDETEFAWDAIRIQRWLEEQQNVHPSRSCLLASALYRGHCVRSADSSDPRACSGTAEQPESHSDDRAGDNWNDEDLREFTDDLSPKQAPKFPPEPEPAIPIGWSRATRFAVAGSAIIAVAVIAFLFVFRAAPKPARTPPSQTIATLPSAARDTEPDGNQLPSETPIPEGTTSIGPPAATHPGWHVTYYRWQRVGPQQPADDWSAVLQSEPLDEQTVESIDLDFRWEVGAPTKNVPADHFATVATNELELHAGTYSIETTSDDGVRVFIDDRLVLENWKWHGPTTDRKVVDLDAGTHRFRIEHFEIDGWACLQFSMFTISLRSPQQSPALAAAPSEESPPAMPRLVQNEPQSSPSPATAPNTATTSSPMNPADPPSTAIVTKFDPSDLASYSNKTVRWAGRVVRLEPVQKARSSTSVTIQLDSKIDRKGNERRYNARVNMDPSTVSKYASLHGANVTFKGTVHHQMERKQIFEEQYDKLSGNLIAKVLTLHNLTVDNAKLVGIEEPNGDVDLVTEDNGQADGPIATLINSTDVPVRFSIDGNPKDGCTIDPGGEVTLRFVLGIANRFCDFRLAEQDGLKHAGRYVCPVMPGAKWRIKAHPTTRNLLLEGSGNPRRWAR